ncbi:sulfotransferase family protein [Aspergillus lucknowensis]|uniref:P-loop containing nucleoside triphosphate hydrolase protein n=1 Tax=Aspergillus lucknowensis TaxID=176173 RepID=A0ABR4LHN9_9EURO
MGLLEKWIYPGPSPAPQIRTKPMQVLALGMSRSGTESLRRALIILGYDHVYHGFDMSESTPMKWKQWALLGRRKYGIAGTTHKGDPELSRADFDAIIGHAEAVTDQPCAIFAPELIRCYPEAKVILNYRDVDAWYDSITALILPQARGFWYHVLPWFQVDMYWAVQYTIHCFNKFFYDSLERNGKWVYEQHSATIKGLVEPDRLLVWRVQDGWEPLCRFLNKPIPAEAFPSGNSLDTTNRRYDKNMVRCGIAAARNFLIFVVLMGVAVAYLAGLVGRG